MESGDVNVGCQGCVSLTEARAMGLLTPERTSPAWASGLSRASTQHEPAREDLARAAMEQRRTVVTILMRQPWMIR